MVDKRRRRHATIFYLDVDGHVLGAANLHVDLDDPNMDINQYHSMGIVQQRAIDLVNLNPQSAGLLLSRNLGNQYNDWSQSNDQSHPMLYECEWVILSRHAFHQATIQYPMLPCLGPLQIRHAESDEW